MDLRPVILLVFLHCTSAQGPPSSSPKEPNSCGSDLQQKILNQILGVPHNKQIPPPPGDVPVDVQVNVAILNIVSVDEQTHLWKTNIYVRQEWDDARLQYANLLPGCPRFRYLQLITDEMVDSFWKPNLFFPDEVDGKVLDLLQSNRVLRIYPNGHVFYSVHASVTLFCSGVGSKPGEFLCPLQMYPYGPEVDSIILSWTPIPNPVQINRTTVVLPDHVVGDIDIRATNTASLTGTYSTLTAYFHFLRKACLA